VASTTILFVPCPLTKVKPLGMVQLYVKPATAVTEYTWPVVFGQTVPGPLIADGAAGTSRAINLLVELLVEVRQVAFEPDNQILPCKNELEADTVIVLVPAPEVMVNPDGIDQL